MHARARLVGLLLVLPLFVSAQAPAWVRSGPAGVQGGPIEALVTVGTGSGSGLVAGGAGGVWAYGNGAWSALSQGEPVSALTMDAGGDFYAGTGDLHGARTLAGSGILFSGDGGQSWTTLGAAALAGLAVSRVAVDAANPAQLWAATFPAADSPATAQPGLYASGDGGTTWKLLWPGAVWDVARSGGGLLAAGADTLQLSVNGGPFVPITNPALPTGWARAALTAQPGGGFLAALALPSGAISLWQVSTAGSATPLPQPPLTASVRALAVTETAAGVIWVGGQGAALSRDGGATWTTLVTAGGRLHALVPTSDGGAWAAGDKGVWHLMAGTAPVNYNSGLANAALLAGATTPAGLLAGVDGGGLWGLPAATSSTEWAALAGNSTSLCGLRSADGALTCSSDGGATWSPPAGAYTSLAEDSGFWLGLGDGQVIDPQGTAHAVGSGAVTALAAAGGAVWAAIGSQLFASQDSGQTWQLNWRAGAAIAAVAVDGAQPTVVAIASGGSVQATADGGLTWHDAGQGLTRAPITALAFDASQQLWAATLGRGWWQADFSQAGEQVNLSSTQSTVTAGSPLQITAQVTAFGEPVSGAQLQFSASPAAPSSWSPAGESLNFTPLLAGPWTIEAQYGTAIGRLEFQVTPAAPARLQVVAGQNQQQAAGTVLQQPLVLRVEDAYGNPVPGVALALAGGNFSNAAPLTGSDGQATVTLQLPNTVGPVTLTATAAGLAPIAWQETAAAPPGYALLMTPQAGAVAPGTAGTLTVQVVPAGGYQAAVALTCMQPSVGCSIAPASIAPGQTATVTVYPNTNQPSELVEVAGDSLHAATANLNLQSFTLTPPTLSVSLNAGQSSAPAALQLTSVNGLSGAVTLTIANLPGNLTAVFEPTQPSLAAAGAAAAVQFSLLAVASSRTPPWEMALGLLGVGLLAWLRFPRRRWVLTAALLGLGAGCGGGAPAAAPPPAVMATSSTYHLQVTATVGGLSASLPVTVIINSH